MSRHQPLDDDDWYRVVQATGLAFASDAVGLGVEWPLLTGLLDGTTIRALRGIQRKVLQSGHP